MVCGYEYMNLRITNGLRVRIYESTNYEWAAGATNYKYPAGTNIRSYKLRMVCWYEYTNIQIYEWTAGKNYNFSPA